MTNEWFWESVDVRSLDDSIPDDVIVRYVERSELDEDLNKSSTDPGLFSYVKSTYGDPRVAELETGGFAFEKKLKDPMYTEESPFMEAALYEVMSAEGIAPEPLYICRRSDGDYLATEFLEEFGDPSELEIADQETFSYDTGYLAGFLEKNKIIHGDILRGTSSTNTLTDGSQVVAIDFNESTFSRNPRELNAQTLAFHDFHSDFVEDERYTDWFDQGYHDAEEIPRLEEEVRDYVTDFELFNYPENPRA